MEVNASNIIHGIGSKIRDLRKDKDLNISEMAKKSGISAPMISKIENGRLIPTIPTLLSLLNVLEIPPDLFFSEINEVEDFPGFLHLKKEGYRKYVKEETAKGFEYLSILERTLDGYSFQVSHVSLSPGNSRPKVTTDAYEFLYLIRGEIDYYLNDELLILREGESLFFDGNIPHVPLNKSEETAEYIVFYFFGNAH
jgi:transcriptional regulator with XRE-family HTH domain